MFGGSSSTRSYTYKSPMVPNLFLSSFYSTSLSQIFRKFSCPFIHFVFFFPVYFADLTTVIITVSLFRTTEPENYCWASLSREIFFRSYSNSLYDLDSASHVYVV